MTTDRAKRYAANRTIGESPKLGCLYCGSKKNLTVDHISGDESDPDPRNLAWACKSCNTRKGSAFKKAGIGRPTEQYNAGSRFRSGGDRSGGAYAAEQVHGLESAIHAATRLHIRPWEKLEEAGAIWARDPLGLPNGEWHHISTRKGVVQVWYRRPEDWTVIAKHLKKHGPDPDYSDYYKGNPDLRLSPEERRNFSQLGFDFPPRAEYDQARAEERKRRQEEHREKLRGRREARRAKAKTASAEEKRRKAARLDALHERERSRRIADAQKLYDSGMRMNPAPISTPGQWSAAVRAVMGQPSEMSTRDAASRIRATPPGQRRKLAGAMRPNPGNVPSFAQYALAVSGYNHGRGEVSLGELIHRTPKYKRSEYASRIAAVKRAHGTDRRTGRYRQTVPF